MQASLHVTDPDPDASTHLEVTIEAVCPDNFPTLSAWLDIAYEGNTVTLYVTNPRVLDKLASRARMLAGDIRRKTGVTV